MKGRAMLKDYLSAEEPDKDMSLLPEDMPDKWITLDGEIKVNANVLSPLETYIKIAHKFNEHPRIARRPCLPAYGYAQAGLSREKYIGIKCWMIGESRNHKEVTFSLMVNPGKCKMYSPGAKQHCLYNIVCAWEKTCVIIKSQLAREEREKLAKGISNEKA